MVLPDGSRISMNKESVIRFPVAFKEVRQLQLKGEAYFEVARFNKKGISVPFKVALPDSMRVEVLGTRFNILAYRKEVAKTTLIEGSVAVYDKRMRRALLKPGQTAIQDTTNFKIIKADTSSVLSWQYEFDSSTTLEELIRKVQMAYGLNAIYGKGVDINKGIMAVGGIDTSVPASEFLRQLETIVLRDSIHFDIIGDNIYITQKQNN